MLPNREGLFHAYPVEVGVDETGPNNLATCIIKFQLFEELTGSEWRPCTDEDLDITGYFYLEKRDGALNSVALDALKAALGWDGRDPFWLQDTDLAQHPVQVKLGYEEYNGKRRLKVQFLNPYGSSGGGVTKADDDKRRSMSTRLGPKFRAMAGPAPAKTPAPATPPAPPTPPEPKANESTLEEAWAAFAASDGAKKLDQEGLEKEWFRILADLFPGKQPDDLTPAEWAKMRDEGPGNIVPF